MKTLSLLAVASAACQAASLSQFVACIGAQGQGLVCQLDAGTYPIASTLRLARPNITIKGTVIASASDTVLPRAPGYTGALIEDNPLNTTGLTSITIRDLTIDGNRSQNTAAYSTPMFRS